MRPEVEAILTKAVSVRIRAKTGPRIQLHAPSPELQEIKDRYLSWMLATRYAEESIRGAHVEIEDLYKFLAGREVLRIADVSAEAMEGYSLWLRERISPRTGRRLDAATILHRLNGIQVFFRWITSEGLILSNPTDDLELPRLPEKLPQTILTQEDARKLLDAPDLRSPIGYRDKAVLELEYATGIRTTEFLRLKITDFDPIAKTVTVLNGKTRKDRIIPLPAVTVGYVKEYIERIRPRFSANPKWHRDALFLNWTGYPLKSSDLYSLLKKHAKAAGIEKRVAPLVLRHSIASHLLENGMNIRYIQEFLGHERLKTTQIYAKVTLSGLRKHYNKHHPKERRLRRNTIRQESR